MKNNIHNRKYFKWALDVLIEYDYTCVHCGLRDENNIIHHLDNCRKNKTLNNNKENLIVLCKQCHAIFHGLTSYQDDIIEYVEMGYSFVKIGEMFNLTKQRIHQIYKKKTGKNKFKIS